MSTTGGVGRGPREIRGRFPGWRKHQDVPAKIPVIRGVLIQAAPDVHILWSCYGRGMCCHIVRLFLTLPLFCSIRREGRETASHEGSSVRSISDPSLIRADCLL